MQEDYRSGAGQPAPSREARIIVLEGDETGQELLETVEGCLGDL